MTKSVFTGPVYVVRDNIDTDQIIPAQYLNLVPTIAEEYEKLGSYALCGLPESLYATRYVKDGNLDSEYPIVLAGKNFGCGSSREHAAWAIHQYGFRAVIAPSFADIFFSNAGKNGLILAVLTDDEVATLLDRCTKDHEHKLTINLEAQTVTDDLGFNAHFDIDPFRKYCLLNGLDDIALTLRQANAIDHFESHHDKDFWSAPKAATA
jgi:3-isopropylmalate/(R)-2-methylmalate dehydratase small subunit